ncbi:FtsK/SpoIIIE domain-containing protein [Curtobacterium sp. SP.BCp]|uniref:FtsK/SpoIIIE domain-containing protein n=1 Tax=Curtobacterium sp. SP.BCp TaxID=3435230 RepID=UPI003F73487E
MRLTFTATHLPTDATADFVVECDEDTVLGEVVEIVARRFGLSAESIVEVAVDSVPTTPHARLGAGVLLEGARLTFGAPAPVLPLPADLPSVRIVGGPGAGTVVVLDAGVAHVGSAPDATVHLPDRTAPEYAAVLRLDLNRRFTIIPTRGSRVLVDGAEVDVETPVEPGGVVAIGDTLLSVAVPDADRAAITLTPGGGTLDYTRPPRLLPEEAPTVFKLPAAPGQQSRRSIPIIAALAPLGMAAVMISIFHNVAYLAFGLMSPIIMFGNAWWDRRNGKKTHRQRVAEYEETKRAVEADALEAVARYQRESRTSAPDPATVLDIALRRRARLWERRRTDPDYLTLRVGTADVPSGVVLEDPAALEHRRAVDKLAEDVPVVVDLVEHGVVGIAGREEHTKHLTSWLVAQLAVLQSPRDTQFVVLTDAQSSSEWAWLRWVPQARPGFGQDAVIAIGNDAETLGARVAELGQVIDSRQRALRESGARVVAGPDVVVVLDGARRLRALPGLIRILKEGPAVGVRAICIEEEARLLPEECSVVVTVGSERIRVAAQRQATITDVRPDRVPDGWFESVARAIAPMVDADDESDAGGLPTSSRLLDVMLLEPPTARAITGGWGVRPRTTEVVVGESLDGPFAFDLRRDGPHGLVAGTTGSGKSELLQTIVASLAATNTPEGMNFVLIDYKGGAAFRDFAPLPHTVGMVTDLDTHLVERALESLGAELRRREHLLAEAAAKDIEDYVERLGRGEPLPPMPRLLIVIDEFASLVRELPDFVTGLVNIAQRGRSLGIHLILATQRPTGVVSNDIRANTNLRIALRVTDSSESTDVIDAGDAAQIQKSTPGRGYIRLGAGALLPFQSGRVGGRRPGATSNRRRPVWASSVSWSSLGAPPPAPPKSEDRSDDDRTDLQELVAAVAGAAETLGGPEPYRPWLDALPESLLFTDVNDSAWEVDVPSTTSSRVNPLPFALQDFPGEQAQRVRSLDLDTDGHLYVVGAPRSGRSQVLRTIAAAVARNTSSADVHVYALDCGNGALLPIQALPHAGAVVQRVQTERAQRLLAKLTQELARRQQVLADGGFASIVEQRAAAVSPADRLPHIVFMLDRWEGFVGSLGELDHGAPTDQVMTMLREGASVGIHLVVTGDRQLLSSRMATLVEDKLVLRLSDRGDYGLAALNPRKLPEQIPDGRAFSSETAVETQIALLAAAGTGQAQAAAITALATFATGRDAGVERSRRPFRVDQLSGPVPFDRAWEMRTDDADLFGLVGIGGDDLAAIGPDLAQAGSFAIGGPAKSGRSSVLLSITRSVLRAGGQVVLVTPRQSPLRALASEPGVLAVHEGTDITDDLLAPRFDDQPGRRVLVIDDAELVKDAPAKTWLQGFVKRAADGGQAIVAAGLTAEFGVGFTGWQVDMKRARSGALLSPQAITEGDLLGMRLPRSSVVDRVQPGSAIVHLGDGELVSVQVPVP